MSILELRDVHRVHGSGDTAVHALRGVTLTVNAGELVAVMGPSGSGKSTLLNLAGGLDRPTRGEVVVDGTVLGALSRGELAALRRRRVGYVFQDLNLLASLTAAENVALPLELDGTSARQARRNALAALVDVDLDGHGPRFPDEPTGALDSQTGEEVLRLLRSRSTPARPACWSPTRRGTPPGPTGWCSCATGPSWTPPGRWTSQRSCWPLRAAAGEGLAQRATGGPA